MLTTALAAKQQVAAGWLNRTEGNLFFLGKTVYFAPSTKSCTSITLVSICMGWPLPPLAKAAEV